MLSGVCRRPATAWPSGQLCPHGLGHLRCDQFGRGQFQRRRLQPKPRTLRSASPPRYADRPYHLRREDHGRVPMRYHHEFSPRLRQALVAPYPSSGHSSSEPGDFQLSEVARQLKPIFREHGQGPRGLWLRPRKRVQVPVPRRASNRPPLPKPAAPAGQFLGA